MVTAKSKGQGLDLAVVKRLVEALMVKSALREKRAMHNSCRATSL
jgi:nitrogen fixation/metabolism regulation signal transduction histidine kinase